MQRHARLLVSFALLFGLSNVPLSAQGSSAAGNAEVAELIKKVVNSDDVAARIAAIDRLAELGSQASAAVPALSKVASLGQDAESRWRAARALAAVGPKAGPAVGALLQALNDQDPLVRAYAAHAMGNIAPGIAADKKDAVVKALVKLAVDPNKLVRREVREALLTIGAPSSITIPLLIKVLEEAKPEAVVMALETLSQEGKKAVPSLCKALDHEKACYWACLVIEQIGPEAAEAVPHLMNCLERKEPEVRLEALLALAAIGEAAKPAASKVIELLESDPQLGVRYAAAHAAGKIGDRRAIPVLEEAAQSQDAFLRLTAMWSLIRLQPDNRQLLEQAVKVFADGLRSKDKRLRAAAANALANTEIPPELASAPLLENLITELDQETIGMVVSALVRRGEAAVPRVIRALQNPLRRPYALQILARLGPKAAKAVDPLVELLKSPASLPIKRETMFALGNIGPAAEKAVPVLIQSLKDGPDELRNAACYALGRIGPAAEKATPQLLDMVESGDDFAKKAGLWALVRIHPKNEKVIKYALPYLIDALQDKRPHVRAGMAGALGDIGPMAKSAATQLQKLAAGDPDQQVRDVATQALVKILDPGHKDEHPKSE